MNCQVLLNYLQKKYKITYSSATYFNGIYYADLGVSVPENPFSLDVIYSCGADISKEMAILKALVESVERIIFISPLVGPLDFIENVAYVRDEEDQLLPISEISPHFSQKQFVTSKGLACHPEELCAKNLSEMEYYENEILKTLNPRIMKYMCKIDLKETSGMMEFSRVREKFDGFIMSINHYFFAGLWHQEYPEYLLGSACSPKEKAAWNKALVEANGKWEKIQKNKCKLADIAESRFIEGIRPGLYCCDHEFRRPYMIKRYHQILSDLNLFMYQSI